MDRRELIRLKLSKRRNFVILHAIRHARRNGFSDPVLEMDEETSIKGKGEC